MKRFTHFLIIVSVLLSVNSGIASAYEPAVQWQKTFGGGDNDIGYSVQQTSDGGYIITGYTYSFGVGGVYLIKTNPNGNLLWEKTFGGYWDVGRSVQQTTDGGYIIAGYTESLGAGRTDVYLIKTDPNGNLKWQKTFGGSDYDYGFSVQQTSDGGYIIAGYTFSFGAESWNCDVYLIKTDSNGNSQWQKTFGGSSNDIGWSVQQTSDGGYIIAGATLSFGAGNWDVYLIKTDSAGNKQWQRTFGESYEDFGHSVQQTSDGGYIIGGWTTYTLYLIKTDSSGNSQWQKTFAGGSRDYGDSVQQTTDGGYIIVPPLIKTDSAGNLQWQKTSVGGYSVHQTSDGGYIIAGGEGDVYLIKLSSEFCQYVLVGDLDDDCSVNWQDLRTFTEQWLEPGGSANLDNFNGVNLLDFALLADNWLIDCNIDPNNPACIPVCQYELAGDLNDDCRVNFYDFAIMAENWLIDFNFSDLDIMTGNWLIDCNIDPENPACVLK